MGKPEKGGGNGGKGLTEQAKFSTIGLAQHLLLTREGIDNDYRSKDLFLIGFAGGGHVSQDRWGHEGALAGIGGSFPTAHDLRAVFHSLVHESLNPLELLVIALRALERRWVRGVAERDLRHQGLQHVDVFLRHGRVHQHTTVGLAMLARVVHDAVVRVLGRDLEIGVFAHNRGTFAAEFEAHVLQVRVCRHVQDLASRGDTAGEADLADARMQTHSGACGLAGAGNDVDDAGRKACFLDQGRQFERGEWRFFGRFEYDGIAAHEGRSDFEGEHYHGDLG